MKHEPITARELCRMVLQKVNEPITAKEVWEIAKKYGYDKRYVSDAVDKSAAPKALLSTESQSHGEFKRDNSNPYRYSLRYPPIIYEKDDEDAKKRAEQIIDNARRQAKNIKDNAEQQAKRIIDNAKQPADQTVDEHGTQQAIDDDEQKAKSIQSDTIIEGLKKVAQLIKEQKLSEAEGFNKVEILIERKLSEAEGLRKLTEDDKVKAEGLRKSAEDDKVKAEAYKIETERLRMLTDADKALIRGREEVEQSIEKKLRDVKDAELRIKHEIKVCKEATIWVEKAESKLLGIVDPVNVEYGYRAVPGLITTKDRAETICDRINEKIGNDMGFKATVEKVKVIKT